MNTLNITKKILFPVIFYATLIKEGRRWLFKKWKKSNKIEDKVAIGFLFTLFLITIPVVVLIPCIFIHNWILTDICFAIYIFAEVCLLISEWTYFTLR